MRQILGVSFVLVFAVAVSPPAQGQCEQWSAGFRHPVPGADSAVNAFALFDDGAGVGLYLGGHFEAAGTVDDADGVVRWDGVRWAPLGSGLNERIYSFATFDDGGGTDLYAAGRFTVAGGVPAVGLARWDGSAWSTVGGGVDDHVWALLAFDDGGGAALYAGGELQNAGGAPAASVARWDGTSWSALGAGTNGIVFALQGFAPGGGPAQPELFAAGNFTTAGGQPANRVARWDGTTWHALGAGTTSHVGALTVFDDGGGPELYAGGGFTLAGGVAAAGIARWDGTSWSALGAGVDGSVSELTVFDDGGGPALYAAGHFDNAGGAPADNVARWDGSAWSPLGSGVDHSGNPAVGSVRALQVFDDGGGAQLCVGGFFDTAGGVLAPFAARWDGSGWNGFGDPVGNGVVGDVEELTVASIAGDAPALYAGGDFSAAGPVAAANVARWDGFQWSALGSGTDGAVCALSDFESGGTRHLAVGGELTTAGGVAVGHVAAWDGTGWSALGTGTDGPVQALIELDDGLGVALIAGGDFTTAGGVPALGIARWDGTSWSALPGLGGPVTALEVYDDGGGLDLYAAGTLETVAGVPETAVARWDGSSWTSLRTGRVTTYDLFAFDDGSGPALYRALGGQCGGSVQRFDGSWSSLSSGFNDHVTALGSFDDGNGPALIATGRFYGNDCTFLPYCENILCDQDGAIARWDGAAWSWASPGTLIGDSTALATFDDGTGLGPALYVGERTSIWGSPRSSGLSRWQRCEPGRAFCFGSNTACPCGNGGGIETGCENARLTGGVKLQPSAFAPDGTGGGTATLVASNYPTPGQPPAIVIRSPSEAEPPLAFGDGLLCIGAPVVRFGASSAMDGTSVHPVSHGTGAGAVSYQVWYRSNPLSYCNPAAAFNLSNGYELIW